MADQDDQGGTATLAELSVDPFGLDPHWQSRIAGLGGEQEPTNPNYVLHTHYVPVAEGHAHFRVRFAGLRGTLGTLGLHVHLYQKGAKHPRLATAERVLLSRLVMLGGSFDVRFEAFHGITYALYVSVEGMTDGAADGVTVVLDRPGDENAPPTAATEARNSDFGRESVRAAVSIISTAKATLATPVTQRCTAAQLAEPAFRDWSRLFGEAAGSPLDGWCAAYILQVLERYGVRRPGARGLGIGAGASPVPVLAAATGAAIEVLDSEADEAVALDRIGRAGAGAGVTDPDIRYRQVDFAAVPRDLVNFDFLWTERVATRLGDATTGLRFAEAAMAHLRPGGLAVHVVDYALTPAVTAPKGVAPWRRTELDRLALILISRGHEVAQVKVDEHVAATRDDWPGLGAAGLIVRKARTVE